MSGKNYFIVIPAFNESATIRTVVQKALQYSNDVIVVDDGSQDDTIAQLTDLPVTVLANATNKGKASTLIHGFKHALENNADAIRVRLIAVDFHRHMEQKYPSSAKIVFFLMD